MDTYPTQLAFPMLSLFEDIFQGFFRNQIQINREGMMVNFQKDSSDPLEEEIQQAEDNVQITAGVASLLLAASGQRPAGENLLRRQVLVKLLEGTNPLSKRMCWHVPCSMRLCRAVRTPDPWEVCRAGGSAESRLNTHTIFRT